MTVLFPRATTYGYDAANQQTAVQRPDSGVLGVQYDLDGQVITRTDALGHRTGYSYDSLHRLIDVADPLGRVTAYGYDLAGNRTSMADPRGNTTAYGYDAANERTSTTRADDGVGGPATTPTSYAPAWRAMRTLAVAPSGPGTTVTPNRCVRAL